MTKNTMTLILGCALALGACGDDDGDDVTDDVMPMDMGGGGMDLGPDDEDMGPMVEEDMGPVADVAPTITRIEWTQVPDCAAATASSVTIEITVDDPDTPAGDLEFTGMAAGCTGAIDAATATVSCPQLAPYNSMVTVTDPEGGSDSASFTIGICTDGSLEP